MQQAREKYAVSMKKYAMHSVAILYVFILAHPCAAGAFQSDSKRFGNPNMDIIITEVDRRPRTSVVDMKINSVGSSVGSSFFIVCSLRDLAGQRGGFRHIVKIEDQPRRGQMLVGFLNSVDEAPERLDPLFAGAKAIDLEQFALICDNTK